MKTRNKMPRKLSEKITQAKINICLANICIFFELFISKKVKFYINIEKKKYYEKNLCYLIGVINIRISYFLFNKYFFYNK